MIILTWTNWWSIL